MTILQIVALPISGPADRRLRNPAPSQNDDSANRRPRRSAVRQIKNFTIEQAPPKRGLPYTAARPATLKIYKNKENRRTKRSLFPESITKSPDRRPPARRGSPARRKEIPMSEMSKMSEKIRKVSELPYERYTVEQGRSAFAAYRAAWTAASTVEQALAAREILLAASTEYATAASLANCRYTLDTRDPFYAGEVDYYDSISPLLGELFLEADRDLLTTPLRPGLEKVMNPRIFRKAELSLKSFSPAVTADCQTENAVVTEYSGLMSGMTFDYEGKKSRFLCSADISTIPTGRRAPPRRTPSERDCALTPSSWTISTTAL